MAESDDPVLAAARGFLTSCADLYAAEVDPRSLATFAHQQRAAFARELAEEIADRPNTRWPREALLSRTDTVDWLRCRAEEEERHGE